MCKVGVTTDRRPSRAASLLLFLLLFCFCLFQKHNVFYTSAIPDVTWYELLYTSNYNWHTRNGSQRLGKKTWKSWKSADESRPSKLRHFIQPEHWEESWRPKETYCLSDSWKRSCANAGEKKKPTKSKIIIICLHTVIWYQVFLSNTNNFSQFNSFK